MGTAIRSKKPAESGVIEPAAVRHHGFRIVHATDDRSDDAMIGMVPGRRQQAVHKLGGNDRVVVEQEHPLGPVLERMANSRVVPTGPAAVLLAPDDGCPWMCLRELA